MVVHIGLRVGGDEDVWAYWRTIYENLGNEAEIKEMRGRG